MDVDETPDMGHVGNKYLRKIYSPLGGEPIYVDVYAVLEAFKVTCPALQHIVKKVLCAGLRNKGSTLQDIEEAVNASGPRAIQMQKVRESLQKESGKPKPRRSKKHGSKPSRAAAANLH